jgi:Double-GTPase 1
MSKLTYQPLESLRIAQNAVGFPCIICGSGNNLDAPTCRHCHAPMALSHTRGKRRSPPKLLSVLGPPGVGKTTYLGMLLDTLSRRSTQLEILLCGAASISLQQKVITRLARCEFPEPTSVRPEDWHWIHAQVSMNQRRETEIAIPDIAGQWWLENNVPTMETEIADAILSQSSGMMLFLDARRLEAGESEPDFQAMKILSSCHAHLAPNQQARLKQPVAIVFTKTEHCVNAQANPAEFARFRAPGLYKLAKQFLPRHAFFSTSLVSTEAIQFTRNGSQFVPLRIEPLRIPEPFLWLLRHV